MRRIRITDIESAELPPDLEGNYIVDVGGYAVCYAHFSPPSVSGFCRASGFLVPFSVGFGRVDLIVKLPKLVESGNLHAEVSTFGCVYWAYPQDPELNFLWVRLFRGEKDIWDLWSVVTHPPALAVGSLLGSSFLYKKYWKEAPKFPGGIVMNTSPVLLKFGVFLFSYLSPAIMLEALRDREKKEKPEIVPVPPAYYLSTGRWGVEVRDYMRSTGFPPMPLPLSDRLTTWVKELADELSRLGINDRKLEEAIESFLAEFPPLRRELDSEFWVELYSSLWGRGHIQTLLFASLVFPPDARKGLIKLFEKAEEVASHGEKSREQ